MTKLHYDAIIIGAGISGISAAYHLQKFNSAKTFILLEQRENLGGTWDLFKYPGARSDSDMYTFGFSFRPWADQSAIAEKAKIIDYLQATTSEYNLDDRIRYNTKVNRASWSSAESRWVLATQAGEQYSCNFIYMCAGYYDYEQGHAPEFKGVDSFTGEIVHPQFWPEKIDYTDKNVVVLGSGATAITLVPSLAKHAGHVTMVQRSPTYLGSKPAIDPIANGLAKWFGRWAARWWFILSNMFIYWYCRAFPAKAKAKIIAEVQDILGNKFDAKHFTPKYNPWDQRVCLCPDGDFFEALKADKASIETEEVVSFTKNGVSLKSGKHLEADIVVTATGLKLQLFGGIDVFVDNNQFIPNQEYVYKGMMLSGVPNTFLAVGYTNASWTLKVDLTHRYASRVINYMDEKGYRKAMATVQGDMQDIPLLDLSSGYIQRSLDTLPRQANNKPWRLNQNFILDNIALRYARVDDNEMVFS